MVQRLEETIIKILEHIIQANEAKDKTSHLNQISVYVDRLRILTRLSKDLAYIDFKRYERLSLDIDEIGKMLGGWIKYCMKNGNK